MKGLIRSFYYAFCGIWECIRSERNFRIHLTAAVAVLVTGALAGFDGSEFAALCSTISLVLFAEMANTAIERVVDIRTPTYHAYAKAAKDLAAGAVLICAILIGALGVVLLCNPFQKEEDMILYIGICLILDGLTNLTSLICIQVRVKQLNRLQKEYPQADVSDLLEQKEKAKAQKQQPVVYEMEPEDKDRSNE